MIGRERGQALIEVVAALPVCMAAALTIVECGVLVRDRLAVTDAAGRAAEAHLAGGDAQEAAERALPSGLRAGVDVQIADERVRVTIQSRTHVPGMPRITQRSEAVTQSEVAR